MGKRWKKDIVTCEICKKQVLRKDTIEIVKKGVDVRICNYHIK